MYYTVEKEANYPDCVHKHLKKRDKHGRLRTVMEKRKVGDKWVRKPVPYRGPLWYVMEDGHATYETLDYRKAKSKVKELNGSKT